MEKNQWLTEFLTILFAAIILGMTVSFPTGSEILNSSLFFLVIILVNVAVKKTIGYTLETDIKTKFWSWYRYGFRKDSHFKKPLPMLWLPIALSFLSRGFFYWIGILSFEVRPKTERVSKRHGLYRFSEVTDFHIASIAVWGIVANLILAIIGYMLNLETFARFNIYYAFWSLIPISELDGSKILFGSRVLWFTMLIITTIFLAWSFLIV